MKTLTEYVQQEHVLQFLKGLNDSYAGVQAQILMMDPILFVSKVFNLVVQGEQHRMIGNYINTEVLAFNTSSSSMTLPTSDVAVVGIGTGRGR